MTCNNCNDTLRLNFEVPLVDGQCDACRFEAETQSQNAEAQAELTVYNQQHGTHHNYAEDATAFFYECEGGGIRRDDLLKFPKLLAFWDAANLTNQWEAETEAGKPAAIEDNPPF